MKKESKSIGGLKGQELNLDNVIGGKQERSHDLLNVEQGLEGPGIQKPIPTRQQSLTRNGDRTSDSL